MAVRVAHGAPAQLAVEISGLEPVLERIAGIAERLEHPEPALEIVADLLELHVARTFGSEGAWINLRWAPLAGSTVRARRQRWGHYRRSPVSGAGPTGPILVWTGHLRTSFTRGAPGHVRQISQAGLVWGSLVAYGRFHQSTAPRTWLPRRPLLAFRDEFQRRELIFQPLRLWVQGVPAGAIRTVLLARQGGG